MTDSFSADSATVGIERHPTLVDLLERVDGDRFDDLFDAASEPLYRCERRGVRTVARLAGSLSAGQIRRLVEFRTAQYARIGFCDFRRLRDALDAGIPLTSADDDDVHIAAVGPDGRLLCSAVLRALPAVGHQARMGDPDRPFFPVERVHGRGVFNRLQVLPELAARQVRELSGYTRDATLPNLSPLAARGTAEVGVAVFRLPLLEPHGAHIDAVIGDLELGVAKSNLDFFGVPAVVLPGTIPHVPDSSFLVPRYETCEVHPFAYLVGDQSAALARLADVEAALELPDRDCLIAMARLRREEPSRVRSTLTPPAGLPAAVPMPHRGLAMAVRRRLLDQAESLVDCRLLDGLTAAEAVVLLNCLEQVTADPGDVVIRSGERGDALYIVVSGEVAVRDGDRGDLARIGPGDYFGEFAVLNGGRRTADVVAVSPVRLWRLKAVHYRQYLEEIIGDRLVLAAAGRMSERLAQVATARRLRG